MSCSPTPSSGHLEIDGHDAETRAASSARENEDLSWEQWADRLQRYYGHVEDLLWPDLIVVGGGVSKKADKFLPLLHLRAPIVPAQLQNPPASSARRLSSPWDAARGRRSGPGVSARDEVLSRSGAAAVVDRAPEAHADQHDDDRSEDGRQGQGAPRGPAGPNRGRASQRPSTGSARTR